MIYDTVIKLSLVEHGVLSGISAVVAMLARGTGETKKFESALGNLKLTAWGAAGVFAGWETIKGIKILADHAKELSHELVQIKNLGITPAQFAQAKTAAFAAPSQVPGITSVDALKIYGQIYSPLGHENSLKMLKPLAEFVQAVGSTTGNYKAAEDKVYNMVRAGDLMGKFMNSMTHQVDIGKLQHFLDLGARVIQATHGRVGADQWFMLAQQGGPALSNMTDQGLLTMAMITQAMGGGRAGTALSSLFTQFQGGIMTKWRALKLMDLGILDKKAIDEITPGGHIIWKKGLEPGTSPFARAMAEDPLKAIGILQSAMATHGYPTIEKQVPLLFELFQRQTSIREIHDLLRNMPQLKQERERITAGLGISASANLRNTQDYTQVMHNAQAAWSDMMDKIGFPITIAAIPVMQKITEIFLKIGTLATLYPEKIGQIAEGIAALGLVLMSGGGVAILAALGPAGWIAMGITAAGIAVATYRPALESGLSWLGKEIQSLASNIDWKKLTGDIKKAFDYVTDALGGFSEKIFSIGKKIWDFVTTLGGLIHKESFGGGGFGGGGSSAGALSAGERGQYAGIIKKVAMQEGVDPNALLKIYGTEGASAWYGDGGKSYGPFQLYTGGGLGNIYGGSRERSARGVEEQTRFVARYGKAHGGWSSDIWHGLQGHGGSIPLHMPSKGQSTENHHHHIYMDGTKIATYISKRLVRAAQYPTSVGRQDGRGTFMGPGAEVFA